jgi:hypothetical protein
LINSIAIQILLKRKISSRTNIAKNVAVPQAANKKNKE